MPDIKCQHCGSYNNIREVVTRCLECNINLFYQKTENMKATLENFLVKWDGENPLWKEFIEWLNKYAKPHLKVSGNSYQMYYGKNVLETLFLYEEEIKDTPIITLEQWKELLNQKTENMKTEFKKGDRVYHIHHGWGEVERISLCIWVNFEKDKTVRSVDYYLLSFTEYRFEGFSQERPFEPEIGKLYWFWDDGDLERKTVVYSVYKGFGHKDFPYKCQIGSNFQNISDKNPLQ